MLQQPAGREFSANQAGVQRTRENIRGRVALRNLSNTLTIQMRQPDVEIAYCSENAVNQPWEKEETSTENPRMSTWLSGAGEGELRVKKLWQF